LALLEIIKPPLATISENIYAVWSSRYTTNIEVIFRASTDGGPTLIDVIDLSNTTGTELVDTEIAHLWRVYCYM